MKIDVREIDGITILDVSGEMYGGPENARLVELLEELAGKGHLDVVLNLAKVKWVASTGLGIMMRARAKFASLGGKVRLCSLNDRVLSLLQVTKMNLLFDVYKHESEAIAAARG
jgi:anti-sigma B factor antagonist